MPEATGSIITHETSETVNIRSGTLPHAGLYLGAHAKPASIAATAASTVAAGDSNKPISVAKTLIDRVGAGANKTTLESTERDERRQ